VAGLGFLILAAGVYYVWQHPANPAGTAEIHLLEQKVAALETRLGRLEQLPAPPTAADIGKLSAKLDVLDLRISDQTQLAAKVDGLAGRIEALTGNTQQQSDKITAQIAALQKASGAVDAVVDRVTKISRIQSAELALASGKPLGPIPNAPVALSRYANAPPPTEAQLLLAFPDMERVALTVASPANPNTPFVTRMWEKAQNLITVRNGDTVVLGNALVTALSQARVALEAGDLATAVGVLTPISATGPKVLAQWLADAKALLDARAALADLAAHV
jgi:hypothetical protein